MNRMGLLKKINFYLRILWLASIGRWAGKKELSTGYDLASSTYKFWVEVTLSHDLHLLDKLELKGSPKVLDLACGTGVMAIEIAKRLRESEILGIDISKEMLNLAKIEAEREGLSNIRFERADMLEKVRELPKESFDLVTCCWAIGYSEPVSVLRQIRRILRKKGKVGIIANVHNSPIEAYNVFVEIIQNHPDWISSIPRLKFPQGEEGLRSMFRKAGLKILETWSGEVKKLCPDGRAVVDWLLKTGAGSVFADTIHPEKREELFEEFSKRIEKLRKAKGIEIVHKFVAGIAIKS